MPRHRCLSNPYGLSEWKFRLANNLVVALLSVALLLSVAMKLCESDGPLAALTVCAACLTWFSSWSALRVSYGLWSDRLYAQLHWSLA